MFKMTCMLAFLNTLTIKDNVCSGMWRKRIPGTLLVGVLLTLNPVGNRLTDGNEICVQTWKVLMKRVLRRAPSNGPSAMDTL